MVDTNYCNPHQLCVPIALSEPAVAVTVLGKVMLPEGNDVGLAAEAVGGCQDIAPVDQ